VSERRLIALRGRDPRLDAWLGSLGPGWQISVFDGPRGVDPRRFGVPQQVRDWFIDGEAGPEPASFGLCLAALERALLEQPPGVWLAGDGQGGALVLALACCWSERLAGAIAIDARLPELPEGAIAEVPMRGLPVLLVGECGDCARRMTARGARVRRLLGLDGLGDPDQAAVDG
jgi:hypothetical protein